ncbi:MAG: hypothetical protein GYB68_16285 [Chloroflexi bacterium]|nr:hypothetical protein [Chloroflexota bacterium]
MTSHPIWVLLTLVLLLAGLSACDASEQPDPLAALATRVAEPTSSFVDTSPTATPTSSPMQPDSEGRIVAGEPRTANLPDEDEAVHTWEYQSFGMRSLFVAVDSTEFDVKVEVIDPEGESLGEDDDSGPDQNARLAVNTLRDGTYQIQVTAWSGFGNYTVSVEESPVRLWTGPGGGAITLMRYVSLGQPLDVMMGGPGLENHLWLLPATAGQEVRIAVQPTESADIVLSMFTPDGNALIVRQDSLGNGGLESAAGVVPVDGMYTITLRMAGVGGYSLTIE